MPVQRPAGGASARHADRAAAGGWLTGAAGPARPARARARAARRAVARHDADPAAPLAAPPPLALGGGRRFQRGGIALASSVGDSEEFAALRDYRPGDPLKRIHWRSWARIGRPVVREYQDEFFVRHALVFDTFLSAPTPAFEEAVSVAASFACSVGTQESLLDLLFVGREAHCVTAGRGVGHVERLLEILAAVRPCRDRPFATLSRLVLEHQRQVSGAVCVLVAWDDARRELVERLRAAGVPTRVVLVTDGSVTDTPADASRHGRARGRGPAAALMRLALGVALVFWGGRRPAPGRHRHGVVLEARCSCNRAGIWAGATSIGCPT